MTRDVSTAGIRSRRYAAAMAELLGEPVEVHAVVLGASQVMAFYRLNLDGRVTGAAPMDGSEREPEEAAIVVRRAVEARPWPRLLGDGLAVWWGPPLDLQLRDLERGQYISVLAEDKEKNVVTIRGVNRRGQLVEGRADATAVVRIRASTLAPPPAV